MVGDVGIDRVADCSVAAVVRNYARAKRRRSAHPSEGHTSSTLPGTVPDPASEADSVLAAGRAHGTSDIGIRMSSSPEPVVATSNAMSFGLSVTKEGPASPYRQSATQGLSYPPPLIYSRGPPAAWGDERISGNCVWTESRVRATHSSLTYRWVIRCATSSEPSSTGLPYGGLVAMQHRIGSCEPRPRPIMGPAPRGNTEVVVSPRHPISMACRWLQWEGY